MDMPNDFIRLTLHFDFSLGGEDFIGFNYGWPSHEGPCALGSSVDCTVSDDANTVDPYHFYHHTALEEGGCVTGSAFVPTGIGWPAKYKFIFIDFIFNKIYNLVENTANECRNCTPPVSGYINETFYERDVMIDLFFGPYKDTQALYLISRGTDQAIRRIRYTGSTDAAPVANITVSDVAVDINEAIQFDGSGSTNDAGEAFTFLWDFGDGETSTEAVVEHSYTEYGPYTVKLTVTDALGQTNQEQVFINVGIPPTANIISPKEGDRFFVGQEILVLANATDRFGVPLNDTQLAWEVRQHHSEHFHPFLDRLAGIGNGFKLDPAPPPEDFSASETSYLEIILYATDSFGLVTTISRDVVPKKVFLSINSTPSGLEVLVDEYPVITPRTITSWENHKLRLNALDQSNFTFSSWSTGGDRKTNFTVPARQDINPTITATFTSDISEPVSAPVAAPVHSTPVTMSPVAATGTPVVRNAPVIVADPPLANKAPVVAPVPVPDSSILIGGTSDVVKLQPASCIGNTIMVALIVAAWNML
jgi:PKD repeat protein